MQQARSIGVPGAGAQPPRARRRSAWRTALGAVTGVLVALAAAGTSAAAVGESPRLVVTWASPLGSPPELSGVVSLQTTGGVRFSSDVYQVRRIEVSLVGPAGDPVGELCRATFVDAGLLEHDLDLRWDTSRVRDFAADRCDGGAGVGDLGAPADNGAYRLRVTGTDTVLGVSASVEREVRISNAPSPPRGVVTAFWPDRQAIRVTWDANPERDLTGYVVEWCRTGAPDQACPSAGWSTGANPGPESTGVHLGITEPGTYWHRVAALRPDAQGSVVLRSSSTAAAGPIVLEQAGAGADDGRSPDAEPAPGSEGGGAVERGSTDGSDPAAGGAGAGRDGRGGASDGADVERSRSAPGGGEVVTRLVQRRLPDPGYSNLPPVGTRPAEGDGETASAPLGGGESPFGDGLVPIAGGLVLLVFSLQARYLHRRTEPVPGA